MTRLLALSISLLFVTSCTSRGPLGEPEDDYECTAAREYITALNYLRDMEAFKLAEKQAQGLAFDVSKGCTNAAHRFIVVTNMLVKARLDTKSSLELATEVAQRNDAVSEAFISSFKAAFMKNGLDLSLADSVRVAKRFSLGFKGDPEIAEEDFVGLVQYCVSKSQLNLPRSACAGMAKELATLSEKFETGVSGSFQDAVHFLRDDDEGPRLTTDRALKIATELIKVSPYAPANFKESFQFASTAKGLKLARNEAVDFAIKIARHTYVERQKKNEE